MRSVVVPIDPPFVHVSLAQEAIATLATELVCARQHTKAGNGHAARRHLIKARNLLGEIDEALSVALHHG